MNESHAPLGSRFLWWSLCCVVCASALMSGCTPAPDAPPVGQNAEQLPATPAPAEPAAPANFEPTPELIAANNRGVALMGQFRYHDAVELFSELAKQHPQCVEVQVNLAIALLNEDQAGKRAEPILAEVLKAQPDNLQANYCLGLILHHAGRSPEALPFLQKVHQADPTDPYAIFLLGYCYEAESKEKALEWYQKAIALDPLFYTACYRQFELERLARKPTAESLKRVSALRNSPTAKAWELKYTRMGPKAMAITLGHPADVAAAGPAFAEPQAVAAAEALRASGDAAAVPTITACDLDGDTRVDLFLTSARKTEAGQAGALLWQQSDGTFKLDTEHALAQVVNVMAAVWGDFNNDGLVDAYLCRRGPNQMWRQVEKGRWEDVTQATNTAGGDHVTVDAAAFDADHDGDLDLFLVNEDAPNELLNNNRDGQGTFQSITETAKVGGNGAPSKAAIVVDLDADLDLDLVVLKKSPPHEVYRNDLEWKYEPSTALDALAKTDVAAAAAGDTDADGRAEIFALTQEGLVRWARDAGGTWQGKVLDAQAATDKLPAQLALADVNGDGQLELVGGRGGWQTTRLNAVAGPALGASGDVPLAAWTLAVLDASRGPAVVGLPADRGPVIWHPAADRSPFVAVTLANEHTGGARCRSNMSGIGARCEFRVGARWTVVEPLGNDSGPGQNLQPIVAGLGSAKEADFLSIQWPDGVGQVEMNLAAGPHRIVESDRMPSSCPVLFAWNGREYAFVTDLLAVGGLGYLTAPGQYAPADPTESFLLPEHSLRERGGRYELKLTEPMQELTYLDHTRLEAFDVPPGWQMALDERLAINGPQPTGQPFYYRELQLPIRATNDRGQDVTSLVTLADQRAAPVGAVDERFVGRLARNHVLTLEFSAPLAGNDLVLLGEGWVEFPYSQTVFAAWQAQEKFAAPTLEACGADGQWQVVCREFGYPGGMPRGFSLPLRELPAGTRLLRITTNLELYWDRLAVVRVEQCPAVQRHELRLCAAEVREGGFIPRITRDQQRPDFDYGQRLPFASTRDPAGCYTRFGPAEELVRESDNALAIFGPGEEVSFEFAQAPACPSGWTRRFVLHVVGWCKDMDFYTQHGTTVEPVPHQGPVSARSVELHERYNTRFQNADQAR